MLCLWRRPGESIMIGDDITVTLLGTRGKYTTLGVTAPRHIVVDREEIHRAKKAEVAASFDHEIARSSACPHL